MRKGITFDDVLLVPRYSDIKSRLDVDTSTVIGGVHLSVPFISSPMDTVTESEMAIALGKYGGLGVIHRFCSVDEQLNMLKEVSAHPNIPLVPAIGVTSDERSRFFSIYREYHDKINMVSIDIANGHHILMKEMVDFVKSIDSNLPIMAGNVATADGFKFLADLGVKAIRVGIGNGFACKTRIQTGFGVPLLTSLIDCKTEKLFHYPDVSIIADGGVLYPGDVVKSLVAGADAVMCGSIFAGATESPGDIIYTDDGKTWKNYRGAASMEIQRDKRGGLKPGTVAEGVSQLIECKGSLDKIINEFLGGLRSGMSYAGARNISELRTIEMIEMSQSGLLESHAHGTRRR
jgi:IMP dehydrogenase